jgi:hypothetical protein
MLAIVDLIKLETYPTELLIDFLWLLSARAPFAGNAHGTVFNISNIAYPG